MTARVCLVLGVPALLVGATTATGGWSVNPSLIVIGLFATAVALGLLPTRRRAS